MMENKKEPEKPVYYFKDGNITKDGIHYLTLLARKVDMFFCPCMIRYEDAFNPVDFEIEGKRHSHYSGILTLRFDTTAKTEFLMTDCMDKYFDDAYKKIKDDAKITSDGKFILKLDVRFHSEYRKNMYYDDDCRKRVNDEQYMYTYMIENKLI